MKVKSYQTAFPERLGDYDDPRVREIEIPVEEAEAAADDDFALLALAFQYGQNDFQPVEGCYSTSVGDVIELVNGRRFRVLGCGFDELLESEALAYSGAVAGRGGTMRAFEIRFRVSYRAKKIRTWTRYATDRDAAWKSAHDALQEEFHGRAVLVDVVELTRRVTIKRSQQRRGNFACWLYELSVAGLRDGEAPWGRINTGERFETTATSCLGDARRLARRVEGAEIVEDWRS